MENIKTEDMLVEVKKFDKDAYIGCDDYSYVSFSIKWWDCNISISDSGMWHLENGSIHEFQSKNPQDILDIVRAIYNCGKPEEEKVVDNEWIEDVECCHNCNNYDSKNQWCRELLLFKSESERCDYCDTEEEKVK